MAITTQQYQTFRGALTTRLAANDPRAPNPSNGQLNNLFNQLATDSTGAVYISPPRQRDMTAQFRAALSGSNAAVLNPNDDQVLDFATLLAADYALAPAPNATQYQIFLRSLNELLSPGTMNPSASELRGYYAALLSL